jgi:hypothetical protein
MLVMDISRYLYWKGNSVNAGGEETYCVPDPSPGGAGENAAYVRENGSEQCAVVGQLQPFQENIIPVNSKRREATPYDEPPVQ